MITLLYSLRRRNELTREAFQAHWLSFHCPHFGLRNDPARMYVVYPALAAAAGSPDIGRAREYDGVAAVWFDDLDGVRASMESELIAVAAEDERLFIDHDRSVAVLAHERVIVEPRRDAPVVLFEHVRRAPYCSSDDFAEGWLEHGERVCEAQRRGLLAGHIQHLVVPGIGGPDELNGLGTNDEVWDGIATSYFDSELLARRHVERLAATPADVADAAATVLTLTGRRPFRTLVR